MIPHIHTLFEFISTPYENQHQTLNMKKIDRSQIRFREYSITLLQPIANFHDRTYCLEKRLLYSQLSGDRQLYSHLSIEILPYSQLSGGKVTI